MVILLIVLFVMFQAVYSWAAPLMDGLDSLVNMLGTWITAQLGSGLLQSLLVDGVLAGVGGVIVFLPQITILFLFTLFGMILRLMGDLLYQVIDPRIDFEARGGK